MQPTLYHIYIGRAYQGPARADSAELACRQYANKTKTSPHIYHAVPASGIKELKEPRRASGAVPPQR